MPLIGRAVKATLSLSSNQDFRLTEILVFLLLSVDRR